MTQPPLVLGDKVWCPRCGEYFKFVRVAGAAKIVDVDRRTVYNMLIAHLVSYPICLDLVNESLGLPLRAERHSQILSDPTTTGAPERVDFLD